MSTEWARLLLVKFPSFDPRWTPEVQAKWWECWLRLLAMEPAPDAAAGE